MASNTTVLKDISLGKKSNFVWGEAVKIHLVGEYAIVEYYPPKFEGNCATDEMDYSQKAYSCYIDNHHISRSTNSLDAALACCIAYKHDGCNTRAAEFFMKMISQ